MKIYFLLYFATAIISCNNQQQSKKTPMKYNKTGVIEKIDAALDSIIDPDAKPEIIAEGFQWCEGPLWVEKHNMLLFSDVPMNTIYKWTEAKGKEVYLKP